MSPRLRIANGTVEHAAFSDEVGSTFESKDGQTRAQVIEEGIVELQMPGVEGAVDVATGKYVRSSGVEINFSSGGGHLSLLMEVGNEIKTVSVSAEPFSHGSPERG